MNHTDAADAAAYRRWQAEQMLATWREHCRAEGRSDAVDLADPVQAAEFARVWLARVAWDRFIEHATAPPPPDDP